MNIKLPRSFTYTEKPSRNLAYVKNGKLYIEGNIDFENLMYNLTYALHGHERCCYCGSWLTEKSRTFDHMFPRAYGGVSIPDNLIPSCKKCNNKKNDMTYHQYIKYLKCQSDQERQEQYEKSIFANKSRIEKGNYVIPKKWLVQYDITKLLKQIDMKWLDRTCKKKGSSYVKRHAESNPIIVSSNGYMFKGVYALYYAKKNGLKEVPVIMLDNVIKVW